MIVIAPLSPIIINGIEMMYTMYYQYVLILP